MQLKKCSFAVTALITCALAAHATDWSLPVMPGGGKAGASFENETYGGGTVAYVSKLGNHIAPFDTWEKAATNVQDAVASDTAMVIVSNGTYRVPTPDITLDKPIVLKSFSGPRRRFSTARQTAATRATLRSPIRTPLSPVSRLRAAIRVPTDLPHLSACLPAPSPTALFPASVA